MSAPIVVRGDARALPLPDSSVDAVVCDPPYELSFMGRSWDSTGVAFDTEPWREALRVLKPGGHLAAFGATRTYHRLGCAIEDAGFEVRDSIRAGVYAWVHGQGFPKSLDVGKAIDKAGGGSPVEHGRILRQARERSGLSRQDVVGAVGCTLTSLRDWEEGRSRAAGEAPEVCTPSPLYRAKLADLLGYTADERQVAGVGRKAGPLHEYGHGEVLYGPAATDAARTWDGWGTALKPAWEPVILARKPQDTAGILVEIGSHLDRLERECSSSARPAAASSAPTPPGSPAERVGTAPESAAIPPADVLASRTGTGAAADSRGTTATSWSESTATTCSNIVTSWRTSWAELCSLTNTCTTSTTSETTTDLRTLSSCLRSSTAGSMRESLTTPAGSPSLVAAVDALFAAAVLSSRATLARSAVETATASTPSSRPDGIGSESLPELTPQWEPIVVARKPLDGTVAASVLAHGTGAINIDACRVNPGAHVPGGGGGLNSGRRAGLLGESVPGNLSESHDSGRFPSNLLISHHPDCGDGCHELCHVRALDEQSGTSKSPKPYAYGGTTDEAGRVAYGRGLGYGQHAGEYGDSGGASRYYPTFRYEPKAPTWQRPQVDGRGFETVKPLDLMRWLVRLLTPPGGLVLDMFPGTGTTGQAAGLEGFRSLLVELEAAHIPFIRERLAQQVVVDRKTDEAVPVTPAPDDALSLFDLEAS